MSFVSETEVALSDPAGLARRLDAQLRTYEIRPISDGASTTAEVGRGTCRWTVAADALRVRVEAADQGELEMVRSVIAGHLVEFAQAPIVVRWTGLAREAVAFDHFRELALVAVTDLTPRMRRLTFAGHDLARFATSADLHVRLYLPPPGLAQPEWPRPGPDGRTLWPEEARRPAARYYTLRRVDPERGEVEIDFVRHPDGGPGAGLAEAAVAGDRVGMIGPLGRGITPAGWTLLAGDETALPAIARILEGMPADAQGTSLIEVADADEIVSLEGPPGMSVRWLVRDGAPAGTPDRLLPEIVGTALAGDDVFVWVGCEFALAKALRRHFERERGLTRARQLIVGYWSRTA